MLGRTIKMLGRTIKMLGRTLGRTMHWAQKTDVVQLVLPMSQFDGFVRPFLHYMYKL